MATSPPSASEDEMKSPTPGRGAELSSDRTRVGLLALAVAMSAGIHIGLAPEHLDEMPRLGYLFIVAAVAGTAIAIALILWPDDRRIAALAGFFCLGQVLAWVLFVTTRVPGVAGTPEPVEAIAVVSKAVEAVGWALAFVVVGSGDAPVRKRAPRAYRATTSSLTSTSAPISPRSFKALVGRSPLASASPRNGRRAHRVGRS